MRMFLGYCDIYLYFCIFWFGDVGDVLVCLDMVFVYVLLGFIDECCNVLKMFLFKIINEIIVNKIYSIWVNNLNR